MKKREAMRLVKALRSGKFEQTSQYLSRSGQYCCLGVACELSGIKSRKSGLDASIRVYGKTSTRNLPPTVMEKFGFFNNMGKRRDDGSVVIEDREYMGLAHANDRGVSFAKIADYIEANYKEL